MWLIVGGLTAIAVLAAPWRWAAAIVAFVLPFSGTMVGQIGADPLVWPALAALALIVRLGLGSFAPAGRAALLGALTREPLLALFALYGVASGVLFPSAFAGAGLIVPAAPPFSPAPLGPQHVSVPQLAYLLVAALTYYALRQGMDARAHRFIALALLVQAGAIGAIAAAQALVGLGGATIDTSWIVNNKGYALSRDYAFAGFVRVSGVFPEASAFAQWGVGALGFCYGLLICRLHQRAAGLIGAALAMALLLSTSSSAYAGLGLLAAFAIAHAAFDPAPERRARGRLVLASAAALALAVGLAAFAARDGFLAALRDMLLDATVEKRLTYSAYERGVWAQLAFEIGLATNGLGAGYGVLRSSGLAQGLFGAVGVVGLGLYTAFALRRFKPAFVAPETPVDGYAVAGAFGLAGAISGAAVAASGLNLAVADWAYAALAMGLAASSSANPARRA